MSAAGGTLPDAVLSQLDRPLSEAEAKARILDMARRVDARVQSDAKARQEPFLDKLRGVEAHKKLMEEGGHIHNQALAAQLASEPKDPTAPGCHWCFGSHAAGEVCPTQQQQPKGTIRCRSPADDSKGPTGQGVCEPVAPAAAAQAPVVEAVAAAAETHAEIEAMCERFNATVHAAVKANGGPHEFHHEREALKLMNRLHEEEAKAAAATPVATDEPHLMLIRDLEAKPASPERNALLAKARAGLFHCDKSPNMTPHADLKQALNKAGYTDMLDKIDEYDNSVRLSAEEQDLFGMSKSCFTRGRGGKGGSRGGRGRGRGSRTAR